MFTLTLMVPGLSQAPPIDGAGLKALAAVFARAQAVPAPLPSGFERRLFALFGAESQQDELPVAAVTRLADTGRLDTRWWLRADPVHLRLEQNRLVLVDNHLLGLTQAQADPLLSELLPLCPPGWRLEAPQPGRWYLQPPAPLALVTTPLSMTVGLNVQPHLPSGGDAARLRAWLTELQMQLHASPVNAAREARGDLPVNSLWFWGGGALPPPRAAGWTQLWAGEPIAAGLARLADVPQAPAPANAQAWLSQAAPGRHLLVLDQGLSALQYRDATGWREFIEVLAADWIAPLLSMLKQKRLARMTLYSDTGPALDMTTSRLRRFWQRGRRPLQWPSEENE